MDFCAVAIPFILLGLIVADWDERRRRAAEQRRKPRACREYRYPTVSELLEDRKYAGNNHR